MPARSRPAWAAGSPSGSSLQHHDAKPETNQLQERLRQRPQPEELRPAVHARIVMHAHFLHATAADLQLAHQFDADRTTGRGEVDLVQQLAADQPVIAIDIANADAKEQARAEVVDAADPYAMCRIMALQLVTVDQTGAGLYQCEQARQFPDIVLAVAIGV